MWAKSSCGMGLNVLSGCLRGSLEFESCARLVFCLGIKGTEALDGHSQTLGDAAQCLVLADGYAAHLLGCIRQFRLEIDFFPSADLVVGGGVVEGCEACCISVQFPGQRLISVAGHGDNIMQPAVAADAVGTA